jgi:HTH-type transcriptional regulator/antitoxin HigA
MATQPTDIMSGRYWELIRRFPLRPIRSDAELDCAIAVIHSLIDQDQLDADEDGYLDVLGDLVQRYEKEHHPLPSVSDADMLRHLIESREVTPSVVAAGTGIAEATIAAILAGERGLSRNDVGSLSDFFHVSPAVFSSE